MSLLVADYPRCGAKQITFDVRQELYVDTKYGEWFELSAHDAKAFKRRKFM